MPVEASLQCGRIYKDAEIFLVFAGELNVVPPFNVAASIKMRKFHGNGLAIENTFTFNVAASIKMRKSNATND